jgi:hypothetical protein
MLDLSKNNPAEVAEEGFEFAVVLPDGTVTDAKIKVRGSSSKKVRDHGRQMFREMQIKEEQARRRSKPVEQPSLEELEEKAAVAAAVRVISWSNMGEDGEPIPFSQENAERLFKKYPFLRDLVIEESDNIHNFRFESSNRS